MRTILQINSSIYSANGQSSKLAALLVAKLRATSPEAELIVRDLGREPLPHLDAERFGAFLAKAEARTPAQHAAVRQSDALIEELQRADAIVLAAPMYNFGVASQLKAWFDHVARAGITFRYTAKGPVGLLAGKKAYVVTTRGGKYAGTGQDHETPFLRQFFGFLGITGLEFVYAEGLAMGEAPRSEALSDAREAIGRIAAEALVAA